MPNLGRVLIIAGSDSGGGAGIQADLKVFAALGVHGTTAITAVTAQNPLAVRSVHRVPPAQVAAQLEAVWDALPPRGVKTGMLGGTTLISSVVRVLNGRGPVPLVIDPVMISTSGRRLLDRAAVRTLQDTLFPLAALVTPNKAEAECLLEIKIGSIDHLRAAACLFVRRFGVPVVMKGGHLPAGQVAADVFWDGRRELVLEAPRVRGVKTHGTGCTFSAAVTAHLAKGLRLPAAVQAAKDYTFAAIEGSVRVGRFTALGFAPK